MSLKKILLLDNAVFEKTLGNMKTHRDIKLVTTEAGRKYLVREPNFYTTIFFPDNSLVIKAKGTQILMNKLVYTGLKNPKKDVETRLDTLNTELEITFLRGKAKQ